MRKLAMSLMTTTSLGRWARPLLRKPYERRYWSRGMNLMSGVFPSFEEALRHAPPGRPTGWDEKGIAANIVGDKAPARARNDSNGLPVLLHQPSTFAVLLWLNKVLKPGARVVDVGGASGLTYWHYRHYFDLPPGVTWTVVDVPEVIGRAKHLAAKRGVEKLLFCEDLAALGECDVLMSLGCIQYMSPTALATFMEAAQRARTVIVNKIPLIDGPDFWTLQSLGTTFAPYQVANRVRFLRAFADIGLDVCDAWDVPELNISIPFEPGHHVPSLNGLVLRRRAEAGMKNEASDSLRGPLALVGGA